MKSFKRSFLTQLLGTAIVGVALSQGAYAQAPATPSLVEKIAGAKTRADHEAVAVEFDKQAETDKASAERHRKMAQAYATVPWSKSSGAGMVAHCKALIADYEKAAKQNAEMARMHREVGAKLP